MRRINASTAALAISGVALFVALGGTAVAVSQIGTSGIQNGAVTNSKLHGNAVTGSKIANGAVGSSKLAKNAVTSSKIAAGAVGNSQLAGGAVGNSKLADNAVTGSKVADGSLTASDIAPNTFLDANGTAADSSRLGDLLPADFVQGVGIMEDRRIVVPEGTSGAIFLNTLFGSFTANCDGSGHVQVVWTPTVSNAEYAATITSGTSVNLVTLNGIPAGVGDPEPVTASVVPISITYQIGYTSGLDHVATAWITGRFELGTGCVFIGQELSST
jgi:hypothetical protein